MHKRTMYDCGFWHGKHSSECDQMTINELQGYANACMLGMIERQELPVELTYEQEIECEDSWVQGYNDAREIDSMSREIFGAIVDIVDDNEEPTGETVELCDFVHDDYTARRIASECGYTPIDVFCDTDGNWHVTAHKPKE